MRSALKKVKAVPQMRDKRAVGGSGASSVALAASRCGQSRRGRDAGRIPYSCNSWLIPQS
jgi:hypothetical protein